MTFPLEGVRVLDLSRVLAGPFAARMLCDLGADVVKLEPPDGDVTRFWGANIGGNPGYYHQQNVGKRNICIDLSNATGPRLVRALAAKADIVIENFRPGVADRLGVGYAALSADHPGLVMLSISGFGQTGPESRRAAYAPVIHAEAGLIMRQAVQAGGPPKDFALSMADTNAGLHGLVATLAALWMRERTGIGQHIDLAMLDAMLTTDDFLHFWLEHAESTKNLPSEVWDTVGGPMLIAGDFRNIWRVMTTAAAVAEPESETSSVAEKAAARRAAVQDFLLTFGDRESLIAALDGMNLAWGDVRTSEAVPEQPTVRHRGSVARVDDREGGTRPIVQSPYRFSAAESGVRGPAPWRGEHNAEVLREWLGLDDAGIAEWSAALIDHPSAAPGSLSVHTLPA